MAVHRWLALLLSGVLVACSGGDDDAACAPANVVDDDEIVSTTQALSPRDQRAVLGAIEDLAGAPRGEAAALIWSEAASSTERALVRDLVETAWIDADVALAARLVSDVSLLRSPESGSAGVAATHTALLRVVVGGDLVLALSEGELEGAPYRLHDLFRVSEGRVVERWSGQRPARATAIVERAGKSGATAL